MVTSLCCFSRNARRAMRSRGVSPKRTTCFDRKSTSCVLPVFGWNVQSALSSASRKESFSLRLFARCSACLSRKLPFPPRTPSSAIISHRRLVLSLSFGAKVCSSRARASYDRRRALEGRPAPTPLTDADALAEDGRDALARESRSTGHRPSKPPSISNPRAIALEDSFTFGAKVKSGFSSSTCTLAAARASFRFRKSSPTRS
mmetsp:Transcript_8365/g.27886  ORF Transcript_8365/g.27886 Transcript_8365/m.27886 type:complete len:203 (+) Transcript_8365:1531-2139(+)